MLSASLYVFKDGYWSPAGSYEPPVANGLFAWWDASDVSTITESGGDVSQWDDKSGNGRNLFQANSALQPQTGVDTLNGRNVVTGESESWQMATASSVGFSAGTYFGAWEYVSGSAGMLAAGWMGDYVGVYADGQGGAQYQAINSYVSRNNGIVTTTQTRDQFFDTVTAGPNVTTTSGTGTTRTNSFRPFNYNNVSSSSGLKMGEFLVYNRILSTFEIMQTEAYLARKWGVTLA